MFTILGSSPGPPDTRDFLLAPSNVTVTEMDTAVFVCVPADPSYDTVWEFDDTTGNINGYYISIPSVDMLTTVSCTVNGNSSSATVTVQGK